MSKPDHNHKTCRCNKNGGPRAVSSKLPLVQICFLTLLESGNTFDNTRQGLIVVNWKDVKLGPIQTKCRANDQHKSPHREREQKCATLTGNLYWTVGIPVLSQCAAIGSNVGFQSVSGVKPINQEICTDFSRFNICNLAVKLVEIKVQPNPCSSDATPGTLVGGLANIPDQCDCIFPNGTKATIPNEFGNCQQSCDNLVFNPPS